jgi:hypothetical protein
MNDLIEIYVQLVLQTQDVLIYVYLAYINTLPFLS